LDFDGTELKLRRPLQCVVMAGALLGWTPGLHAGERATLSNGFAIDCNHHALVEGRMRLYLSPGQDSYIELKPGAVTSFETVPDASGTVAGMAGASTEPALSTADLHQMLATAGQAYNLDVDLLASVVKAESNGNAHAISRAGARGLMQLMPATATNLGVEDSFQPGDNVRGGSAYLDSLLRRYHDNLALALAAYNAGPAAVDKYHAIPPYRETRVYVARVIHEFNRRVRSRQLDASRSLKPEGVPSSTPASP
jgi:Transglycosylase SLT domain